MKEQRLVHWSVSEDNQGSGQGQISQTQKYRQAYDCPSDGASTLVNEERENVQVIGARKDYLNGQRQADNEGGCPFLLCAMVHLDGDGHVPRGGEFDPQR